MIISQTPFRISLFGGGSDFAEWFQNEKGQVISGTIDKFAYITLRELPPFFPHRIRAIYSIIDVANESESLKHPAMRAIFSHYVPGKGLETSYQGDLPAQSGVGSSSSFTVGLIAAVQTFLRQNLSREQLARNAIWIEQEVLKERVGLQDQISAAFGGLNHIVFGPGRSEFSVRSINGASAVSKMLSDSLVLVFSGKQRFSSQVQEGSRPESKSGRTALLRTVELVDEFLDLIDRRLPTQEFLEIFAELIEESWSLKASLNPFAVTPELEAARESLKSRGALGVKVLGAGGGGFLLAVVNPERKQAFIDHWNAREGGYALGFSFVDHGSRLIHNS